MEVSPSECSICTRHYDFENLCPRILTCGHTFCSECIHQFSSAGLPVSCPVDRKTSKVPEGGFPKNFLALDFLEVLRVDQKQAQDNAGSVCVLCEGEQHPATHHCLDCKEMMCAPMASAHVRSKASSTHQVKMLELKPNSPLRTKPDSCPEHEEVFKYFDKQCNRLVCVSCVVLTHRGHECTSLAEAAKACRAEVESLITKGNGFVAVLNRTLQQVQAAAARLDNNNSQALTDLKCFFDEVILYSCF
jgi:hypothetical protein